MYFIFVIIRPIVSYLLVGRHKKVHCSAVSSLASSLLPSDMCECDTATDRLVGTHPPPAKPTLYYRTVVHKFVCLFIKEENTNVYKQ